MFGLIFWPDGKDCADASNVWFSIYFSW